MINKTIRFNLFTIKATQPTRNLISKHFYYIKIVFFLYIYLEQTGVKEVHSAQRVSA